MSLARVTPSGNADHSLHRTGSSALLNQKIDNKGHFYDEDAPAPTSADEKHIREEMAKLDSPGEWSFVRTLYQNKQPNNFHRIVHLFLKYGKDNNIEEVQSRLTSRRPDRTQANVNVSA